MNYQVVCLNPYLRVGVETIGVATISIFNAAEDNMRQRREIGRVIGCKCATNNKDSNGPVDLGTRTGSKICPIVEVLRVREAEQRRSYLC